MAAVRYSYLILAALLGLAAAVSSAATTTSPYSMQSMIDEENHKCESGEDSMACIKVRAMRFLDTVMSKDEFKFSDIKVTSNDFKPSSTARSNGDNDLLDTVENYIQGHDVTMDLPVGDAKVSMSARNLANNELSLNIKLADGADGVVEGKGKKGNIFKKGVFFTWQ